jgi:hypothetical protein
VVREAIDREHVVLVVPRSAGLHQLLERVRVHDARGLGDAGREEVREEVFSVDDAAKLAEPAIPGGGLLEDVPPGDVAGHDRSHAIEHDALEGQILGARDDRIGRLEDPLRGHGALLGWGFRDLPLGDRPRIDMRPTW